MTSDKNKLLGVSNHSSESLEDIFTRLNNHCQMTPGSGRFVARYIVESQPTVPIERQS